jgi:hypothetical protein
MSALVKTVRKMLGRSIRQIASAKHGGWLA